METNLRNIFKQTSIYGFFNILSKSVGFLLLPLYTRYLKPEHYGTLELLETTATVFGMFASVGLGFSVFKFYHKYDTKDEQDGVISSALVLCFLLYSALALGGLIFSRNLSILIFESPNFRSFFIFIFLRFILDGLVSIGIDYIRVLNMTQLFGWLSLLRLVLSVGLNILFLVVLGMGITGILLSALISQLLLGIPLLIFLYNRIGFHFDTTKLIPMVKYSLPFVGVLIGQLVINNSDRFILQRFVTLADVGVYSLGYKFGFMVNFFVLTPFLLMWEGKMFEIEKLSNAKAIYSQTLTYLTFSLIFVALILTVFIDEILTLVVAPGYHDAELIVPLIALAYIFNGLQTFFRLGMLIKSKTSIIGTSVIIQSIFSLGVYFVTIRLWGTLGAAMATALSFLGVFIANFLFSQNLYRIPIETARLLRLAMATSLVLIISHFLPEFKFFPALLIKSGLIILFFIVLLSTGFLNDREKSILHNLRLTVVQRLPGVNFCAGQMRKFF